MLNNNFNFSLPAEIVKAEDGKGWKIRGLATTEDVDLQGEQILQRGLDLSRIDQGRAALDFEHRGKSDPKWIIGTVDSYEKTSKGLMIEASLFKKHDTAKAIQQILESLPADKKGFAGFSVEGHVTSRDAKNPNIINAAQISNVSLTFMPVNPNTYAELAKSMSAQVALDFNTNSATPSVQSIERVEQPVFTATQVLDLLQKTLGVSGAYATTTPGNLSGGEAMAQESLAADPKAVASDKKKPKKATVEMNKSNIETILNKISMLYPAYSRETLWECLKERLTSRYINT